MRKCITYILSRVFRCHSLGDTLGSDDDEQKEMIRRLYNIEWREASLKTDERFFMYFLDWRKIYESVKNCDHCGQIRSYRLTDGPHVYTMPHCSGQKTDDELNLLVYLPNPIAYCHTCAVCFGVGEIAHIQYAIHMQTHHFSAFDSKDASSGCGKAAFDRLVEAAAKKGALKGGIGANQFDLRTIG